MDVAKIRGHTSLHWGRRSGANILCGQHFFGGADIRSLPPNFDAHWERQLTGMASSDVIQVCDVIVINVTSPLHPLYLHKQGLEKIFDNLVAKN